MGMTGDIRSSPSVFLHRNMYKKVLLVIGLVLSLSCQRKESSYESRLSMTSPDGSLVMEVLQDEKGSILYDLSKDGCKIILPSHLGFELRGKRTAPQYRFERQNKANLYDIIPLKDSFEIVSSQTDSSDSWWEPVWGEEEKIRDNHKELLVNLLHKPTGYTLAVRFRLFDDGLGFRYEFPAQEALKFFAVKEECTEFRMAEDCKAWWIPVDFDSQEYEYHETPLSGIPEVFKERVHGNVDAPLKGVVGVQTSLIMKNSEGYYINIHEAALKDYSCMHLKVDGTTLTSFLTPDAEGWKGYLQAPCTTPWRTVQVTAKATDMLQSRLVLNLNEPCAYEDVSWIHPVKYMGVWWEMISGRGDWHYTNDFSTVEVGRTDYASANRNPRHSANTENVCRYIDFASENGFDAVLVEGWNQGWEDWDGNSKDFVYDFVTPYPDFDIEYVNAYARSKGISLVMHHETASSVRNYERRMEEAYSLMEKYGYKAVKSGYCGDIIPRGDYHYSQFMVNHYLYAVTQAAKHHIMVNAHEAVRPTGLCRTYPNLIGNESAKGTEYQAFGGITPGHVTILPFTRLNGGPMDYTPGIFKMDCASGSHVNSTLAGQLALYLTMYSPLQMAADLPENYMEYPDAFEFIKEVALDWSESRYLFAEPGDYVIVARKAKDSGRWFMGGVTDGEKRSFDIPLDFLGEGTFEATIYSDAPDAHYKSAAEKYVIEKKIVTFADSIPVTMAPGGGFAVSLKEKLML